MTSTIEFEIYRVIDSEDGVLLHGIVLKGDIKIGDQFLKFCEMPKGIDVPKYPATSLHPLKISKIIAYRRELDELPKGMSGELHVNDIDNWIIKKGDILSD